MAVPVQADVAEGEIVIVGITPFVIVIEIGFEVAVVEDAHVAFDVSIQFTTCPFVSVEELYVVAFVPTFTPFICHW